MMRRKPDERIAILDRQLQDEAINSATHHFDWEKRALTSLSIGNGAGLLTVASRITTEPVLLISAWLFLFGLIFAAAVYLSERTRHLEGMTLWQQRRDHAEQHGTTSFMDVCAAVRSSDKHKAAKGASGWLAVLSGALFFAGVAFPLALKTYQAIAH